MWLSKMLSKNGSTQGAEQGLVTMAQDNSIEASATSSERDISVYAPYGINSLPPKKEEVLLVPSGNEKAALGVKTKNKNLNAGEVLISSLGGAKILLKNDGSVVINDNFIINKEGEIDDQ